MAGNFVVFCADGTWNGPGNPKESSGSPSNVYKLFCNLSGAKTFADARLQNEQELFDQAADGMLLQAAKYIHGVGDSSNYLVKWLGGGAGMGIIARIVRG